VRIVLSVFLVVFAMEKRKISQKDFDRKIKIWGTIIPVVVAVISSLTTIFVAYYSSRTKSESQFQAYIDALAQDRARAVDSQIQNQNAEAAPQSRTFLRPTRESEFKPNYGPKVEYRMTKFDQLEANILSQEMKPLITRYYKTRNVNKREELDLQLTFLSIREAEIMIKYNPSYQPRWSNAKVLAYLEKLKGEYVNGHPEANNIPDNRRAALEPPQGPLYVSLISLLRDTELLIIIAIATLASFVMSFYLTKRVLNSTYEIEPNAG
jgi:hypothetical protein